MKKMDGRPVRDVPPDWIGRRLPLVDESTRPKVAWWARHPNGTFTPVYTVSERPYRDPDDPDNNPYYCGPRRPVLRRVR